MPGRATLASMSISGRDSLKSLAFLYLTFGHSTDGTLSMDEMRALADRLGKRVPKADLDEIAEVIKAAVADYKALDAAARMTQARQHTDALRTNAEPGDVQQVLDDLREIASADGHISPEEEKFIADVAAALGGA